MIAHCDPNIIIRASMRSGMSTTSSVAFAKYLCDLQAEENMKAFKAPTWDFLKNLVRGIDPQVCEYLNTVPKRYRKAIALAISVAKWTPGLDGVQHSFWVNCGLCCLYDEVCDDCPLNGTPAMCHESTSPFYKYVRETDLGKLEALQIEFYNDLVKLYTEEYHKA